jgi:RND family efflux transporter MFP subunit
MSLKRLAVIGIVLCAAGVGGYFWLRPKPAHSHGDSPVAKPAAISVRTNVIEERTLPDLCEYHGYVRSRHQVDVIPQVMGRIRAVHVKAGQVVKAGDVLLELDPAEFQAKVQTAEANVALADAGLVRARQHLKVIEALMPDGNATKEDLDEATASVKSGEANVAAAKARVEEARTYLQYTTLRSPIAGIVVDKLVDPGDLAMPSPGGGASSPAGGASLSVYDPAALWFEARIPERHSPAVTMGAAVQVEVPAAKLELDGRVVEVVPNVDDASRTFLARVDLPAAAELKLGMFGRFRFAASERKAVVVPAAAVIQRGQLDAVFVVEGGCARLRLMRRGKALAREVEALSGLRVGESVILMPAESLRDGDPVAVEKS